MFVSPSTAVTLKCSEINATPTNSQTGHLSVYQPSPSLLLLLLRLGSHCFLLLLFCLSAPLQKRNKKTTLGAKKQVNLFTYSLQVWARVCGSDGCLCVLSQVQSVCLYLLFLSVCVFVHDAGLHGCVLVCMCMCKLTVCVCICVCVCAQ